jgi:hypothetical protein
MAWGDLANNQLVNVGNLQGSNITTKLGKVLPSNPAVVLTRAQCNELLRITSIANDNRCVIKSELTINETYYTKAFYADDSGGDYTSTTALACSIDINGSSTYTFTLESTDSVIGVGSIVWEDDGNGLWAAPYNGYSIGVQSGPKTWYKFTTTDDNGVGYINYLTITDIGTCTPSITYTQIFGWYTSPCGPQITIYEGSNGLYYSDTSGTLFNGTVYIFIGPNDVFSYDWSEQPIVNGVFDTNTIVQSGCQPS